MGAGRKLRNHRRKNLWADKDYKKSHLGNEWKKPFAGASHAKGIVLEKMCAPAASEAVAVVAVLSIQPALSPSYELSLVLPA